MKYLYYILLISLLGFACNNNVIDKSSDKPNQEKRKTSISKGFSKRDSVNKSLKWRELNCGLWINKDNEIGLKATEYDSDAGEVSIYLTRLDTLKMIDVIDTNTFVSLGNSFYKDKSNIYHHHLMACGGSFYIRKDIDYITFKVINDCYAKDKNNVYEYRGWPVENVDINTFNTNTAKYSCFAKDKNHYYRWGDTLLEEEMKDSVVMEAIKILNN